MRGRVTRLRGSCGLQDKIFYLLFYLFFLFICAWLRDEIAKGLGPAGQAVLFPFLYTLCTVCRISNMGATYPLLPVSRVTLQYYFEGVEGQADTTDPLSQYDMDCLDATIGGPSIPTSSLSALFGTLRLCGLDAPMGALQATSSLPALY